MTGFDKLSFVIGSSSNLFNEFNTSAAALAGSSIGAALPFINSSFVQPSSSGSLQRNVELDTAIWPNPFKGLNSSTYAESSQDVLSLVDGGEDGQVIPLAPLIVKSRAMDVVIALDASADLNGFAVGESMVASQNRTTQDASLASIYRLPPLPTSTNVFIGQGLQTRPTFFGCGNFTSASGANISSGGGDTPLIIYLANGGPPPGQAPLTNTTTSQTIYTNSQIQGMLDQTFDIVTQGFSGSGNTTKDEQWPLCLACAIFEPARARASNVARAPACDTCFSRYCWDGNQTVSTTSASGSSSPSSPSGTSPPSGTGSGKSGARSTMVFPSHHVYAVAGSLLVAVLGGLTIL